MINQWHIFVLFAATRLSNAIPIDNGVQGEPEVKCGENSIGINFQTRNPFEGHVFVKGYYSSQGCKTDETNKNGAQIVLPFSACGIRRSRSANPKGIFVSTTVIITFHPQFITKVDKAYAVQCFYMEADKVVTAELEVSMLTTSLYTQTVPMPVCKYEVLETGPTGLPLKYAKIGDQVYHKWSCESYAADTFCMTVHTCLVDDGTGSKTILLDDKGCAQDKYLLGNLEYITDLSAGREAHVFKYADKPNLFFNCQISIAVKDPGTPCSRPQCAEPSRGKRSVHDRRQVDHLLNNGSANVIETVDVDSDPITVVDLDPKFNESKFDKLLEKRTIDFSKNYNVCMSFIGFSAYAVGNIILILSAIFLYIAAYRKARKIIC